MENPQVIKMAVPFQGFTPLVNMPLEDDIELLDFYVSDRYDGPNVMKMISPLQEDAFSEDVLHDVVINIIDFYLPYDIWEMINDAFSYYWNEEAGLNEVVSEDGMFYSIRKQLIDNRVFFPDQNLYSVISAIWDFIWMIPGAIYDL